MTPRIPTAADADVPARIRAAIDVEIGDVDLSDAVQERCLVAFRAALQEPRPVTVTFSGGITQTCWRVTRSDGDYVVIYMPKAGYFSLCVESAFGPLDIGVHGGAMACYNSV
jgi:hypothetical protein